MRDSTFNPYELARRQLEETAEFLGLAPVVADLLAEQLRELSFRFPVRLDGGGARVFRGYRVVHNDARGPARGGVRFHPGGTLDLIRAQAMWMTWRAALVDVPAGGAAGGVACDPHGLSTAEQERMCRGWVRALARDLGPEIDVPEPDLGTNPQHLLWMLDEHEAAHRVRRPSFAGGKPVGMGGSRGRREAAGFGLVIAVREAMRELGLDPRNASMSIQGFGAVGRNVADLFLQLGGTVACVAAWDTADGKAWAFEKRDGMDIAELAGVADPAGNIDRERAESLGYSVLPIEEWLARDVDILVPAAVENQITAAHVERIRPSVKIVAEGADGAVPPAAEDALSQRGVAVVPSFLASAGGVIGAYFEQVQSAMNYAWERDEVLGKLDVKMTAAYQAVAEAARRRSLSLRDAALAIAVSRVAEACLGRGWV